MSEKDCIKCHTYPKKACTYSVLNEEIDKQIFEKEKINIINDASQGSAELLQNVLINSYETDDYTFEHKLTRKGLLKKLRLEAKKLTKKIESEGKPDVERRIARGQLNVLYTGDDNYAFQSHGITTCFEMRNYEKVQKAVPYGYYSDEAILKSGESTMTVKVLFEEHSKLLDLLNRINSALSKTKSYGDTVKKNPFYALGGYIYVNRSGIDRRVMEFGNDLFVTLGKPNMIESEELVKYMNSRYELMSKK